MWSKPFSALPDNKQPIFQLHPVPFTAISAPSHSVIQHLLLHFYSLIRPPDGSKSESFCDFANHSTACLLRRWVGRCVSCLISRSDHVESPLRLVAIDEGRQVEAICPSDWAFYNLSKWSCCVCNDHIKPADSGAQPFQRRNTLACCALRAVK